MADEQKQQPDYVGHRARLRERFFFFFFASMPDHELLEFLLIYAIPLRDAKARAIMMI